MTFCYAETLAEEQMMRENKAVNVVRSVFDKVYRVERLNSFE